MKRIYQVFISSTYIDLQQARQHVLRTLLRMGHIPVGMELFPAIDKRQWEYIETLINECDYYLLIIGGRYGTEVPGEPYSYTEKEYKYALDQGKRVIALIHEDPEKLPGAETDLYKKNKLEKFRNNVIEEALVNFWNSNEALSTLVAINLPKTIESFPQSGWIRGDSVTNLYKAASAKHQVNNHKNYKSVNSHYQEVQSQKSILRQMDHLVKYLLKIQENNRTREKLAKRTTGKLIELAIRERLLEEYEAKDFKRPKFKLIRVHPRLGTIEELCAMCHVSAVEFDGSIGRSLLDKFRPQDANWWESPWDDVLLYAVQLCSQDLLDITVRKLIEDKTNKEKYYDALLLAHRIALSTGGVADWIIRELLREITHSDDSFG
jgi:hypothetical protein